MAVVTYIAFVKLLNAFHTGARTVSQFQDILEKAGWKFQELKHGSMPLTIANQTILATPMGSSL
jgi:hypothetical protein